MITHSAAETRLFGERLASLLRPGDVLLLQGDLGAGKSELTRGIARGLGITDTITSPTFTILNDYESGRLPLYHFDWYRMEDEEELYEMGLDEYLTGNGVCAVEWSSRCPNAIPASRLEITLTPLDETSRSISVRSFGGCRNPDELSQMEALL